MDDNIGLSAIGNMRNPPRGGGNVGHRGGSVAVGQILCFVFNCAGRTSPGRHLPASKPNTSTISLLLPVAYVERRSNSSLRTTRTLARRSHHSVALDDSHYCTSPANHLLKTTGSLNAVHALRNGMNHHIAVGFSHLFERPQLGTLVGSLSSFRWWSNVANRLDPWCRNCTEDQL